MSNKPSKDDLEIVPSEYKDTNYEVNVLIPEFKTIFAA